MFSLLGEGERGCKCEDDIGVKNGDPAASELSVGDNTGVVLTVLGTGSERIHGAEGRDSTTAGFIGDGDLGGGTGIDTVVTSSCPSA
jgi:hypothetical protein